MAQILLRLDDNLKGLIEKRAQEEVRSINSVIILALRSYLSPSTIMNTTKEVTPPLKERVEQEEDIPPYTPPEEREYKRDKSRSAGLFKSTRPPVTD